MNRLRHFIQIVYFLARKQKKKYFVVCWICSDKSARASVQYDQRPSLFAEINYRHFLDRFNKRQIDIFHSYLFYFFGQKIDFDKMQIISQEIFCKLSPKRYFAWNVKDYFLNKKTKKKTTTTKNKTVVCWNFYWAYSVKKAWLCRSKRLRLLSDCTNAYTDLGLRSSQRS